MDISFTFDLTSIDWLPTEADISGPYPRDIQSIDRDTQAKHLRVGFDSTEDNAVVRNIQIKFQI